MVGKADLVLMFVLLACMAFAPVQCANMYDLTGDGRVDMVDLDVVVSAFGSFPGHPRWNPIADLNGDGIVDTMDIGLLLIHYGEEAGS